MQANPKSRSTQRAVGKLFTLGQHLTISLGLTQRFAIVGILATLLVAGTTSIFVTHYLKQRQLEEVSRRASDVVSHLITPKVSVQEGALTKVSLAQWELWFAELTNTTHVNDVNILNLDGTILYSSKNQLIGQTNVSKGFQEALRSSQASYVLESKTPVSAKTNKGKHFKVFVPIIPRGKSEAIGVYEIQEDFAPIATQIAQASVIVWSLAFLIFGFMFFALLAMLIASKRHQMAYLDPLTGLANRHLFQDKANKVLALSRRTDAAAILYLDLSRFKTVNDSLGQNAGDEVLKQIAIRLKESIRAEDTAARLGSDEFALLLTHIESGERAIQVAKRLQHLFTLPFRTHGQAVHLDVNIGVALLNRESISTVGAWLTQANTAMIKSKADHTKFQIYNPEMQSYTLERLQLEASLRKALEKQEFVLHYQPILNRNQSIIGAEALVRWMHPSQGMVSPGLFIPLAEETGLIRALDQWVMKTAIQQARYWENQGTPLKVSVNLSPQTFQDADFVNWLESQLIESELTPNLLTVEITEYVLAQPESSSRSLEALKHLGVRIALDDFGKGYSSLAYLENLPIDRIKMDRQFIQGIGKRPTSEAIIKTIIALTDNLGIESLAEGIEEIEQYEWLISEGCKFYQGFLFSKPLPVERFSLVNNVFVTSIQGSSLDIHLN